MEVCLRKCQVNLFHTWMLQSMWLRVAKTWAPIQTGTTRLQGQQFPKFIIFHSPEETAPVQPTLLLLITGTFEGVSINTGFNQVNAHVGLTQRALKDKLTLSLDVIATQRESDFGFDRAYQYATIFNPTAPLHTTDPPGSGGLNLTGSGYVEQNFVEYANPLAVLEQNTNQGTLKRQNINGSASYEIIRGLKFGVRYAQQNASNYRWAYLPKTSFDSRIIAGNRSGFSANGLAQKQDDENYSRLFESYVVL